MKPYDLSKWGEPIKAFAKRHRLRTKRDECDELYVPAKRGQIFDHCDGCFGVIILNDTVMGWGYARKKMERAGFQIIQDGDEEGTGLFNPEDAKQVKVALEVVKPYRRKNLSEEQLAKLRQNVEIARSARETLNREARLSLGSIDAIRQGNPLTNAVDAM